VIFFISLRIVKSEVNNLPKIGSIIRKLREDSGWTQAKLGEKLGVAESTISLYESDKREPHIATINRLADIFNVSADYILGRSVDRTPVARRDGEFLYDLPPEALERIQEFKEMLLLKYGKKQS
jgi:transcriptional regulator with XRE-family HTH domain